MAVAAAMTMMTMTTMMMTPVLCSARSSARRLSLSQRRRRPHRVVLPLATSGTPQNPKNIAGAFAWAPSTNTLGPYTISDNPNLLVDGWYYAVQIQGALFGDTNPADWTDAQTVSCSGSLRVALPGGGYSNLSASQLCNPSDNPLSGSIYTATGLFDWIDAPGPHQYIPNNGGMVVGGTLTMNFVSQLTDGAAGCAVDWSVVFKIPSPGRLRFNPRPGKPVRGPRPKVPPVF